MKHEITFHELLIGNESLESLEHYRSSSDGDSVFTEYQAEMAWLRERQSEWTLMNLCLPELCTLVPSKSRSAATDLEADEESWWSSSDTFIGEGEGIKKQSGQSDLEGEKERGGEGNKVMDIVLYDVAPGIIAI